MKKKQRLKPSDIDYYIENCNPEPILKDQVRQVRWLYNNSNKLTMVYDEKLVRAIVFNLLKRIHENEEALAKYKQLEIKNG